MKKFWLLVMSSVVLVSVSASSYDDEGESQSLPKYIEVLEAHYGNDYATILTVLEQELANPKLTPTQRGITLLLRQQYYYFNRDWEQFRAHAQTTETYLITQRMFTELLSLYSLMASQSVGEEHYNEAYLAISKGERLAKKLAEKNPSSELTSTLAAIKYLKVVVALNAGMQSQAIKAFAEAQQFYETNDVEERVDIYTNTIAYYRRQKAYPEVAVYCQKLFQLLEAIDPNQIHYPGVYQKIQLVEASNELSLGNRNKALALTEKISQNPKITENPRFTIELAMLYAKVCRYYGDIEESIHYLQRAYAQVVDTSRTYEKLAIIEQLIMDVQTIGTEADLFALYEEQLTLYDEQLDLKETQYLVNQLVNTDLQNTKYELENLQLKTLQTQVMTWCFIATTLVTVVSVYRERLHQKILRENFNILQRHTQTKEQYFKKVKENYVVTNALKHDFKNHALILQELVTTKNYAELQKYLHQFQTQLRNAELAAPSNNQIVNAIIGHHLAQCQQAAISFTYVLQIPEQLPFQEFDLVVLYGNLLDNALEACRRLAPEASKSIHCKSRIQGDYYFLSISNTYDGKVSVANQHLLTRKKNKKTHGIGLENVQVTVAKYGGDCQITYDETQFSVAILLPLTPTDAQ
ncbi:MAG: GHKL domain-containing protein [Culicoidibacterales bacterium]